MSEGAEGVDDVMGSFCPMSDLAPHGTGSSGESGADGAQADAGAYARAGPPAPCRGELGIAGGAIREGFQDDRAEREDGDEEDSNEGGCCGEHVLTLPRPPLSAHRPPR
ncbi:hypothetical protein GCM10025883_25610 [Mobilicoccus caccae]|uniref:Uncharacterized protein n=1 Tax=Mobilicoccus caccae TaxID=1859295 RepID=A0ABQ6ITX8_9MICO|nr:hypothetical protein GCM10025883_25610 [Mobilicoccus caccae]